MYILYLHEHVVIFVKPCINVKFVVDYCNALYILEGCVA